MLWPSANTNINHWQEHVTTFGLSHIQSSLHRQLFCRLVTVAPPADLYSNGLSVRVQKWCQQSHTTTYEGGTITTKELCR